MFDSQAWPWLLSFSISILLASYVRCTSFKAPAAFSIPQSEAIDNVNLLIGSTGPEPNLSGGMIPSTAPPFGMTRWVAQTQVNYVSATPFNISSGSAPGKVMGTQGTRQPAIWMGESGSIAIAPGVSGSDSQAHDVKVAFDQRGLAVRLDEEGRKEVITPSYYSVELDDGCGGWIQMEQSATSRVAQLRFTFHTSSPSYSPYILIEAARPSIITSTPSNVTFPEGSVVLPTGDSINEICGSSAERQDQIIAPVSDAPASEQFQAYFCVRFDQPTRREEIGIIRNGTQVSTSEGLVRGPLLSAFAFFNGANAQGPTIINARVGTSFISIEQARANIDDEIPDVNSGHASSSTAAHLIPGTLEHTASVVRQAWADKLDRITLQGANEVQQQVWWTGVVHTLQYPSEQHESEKYYSGYTNSVHDLEEGGESYTGYSIWDTYRAQWAWLILMAPERIPGMIRSMLADYQESGWLPMWKNVVETNIMVATHADSLIAEAVYKNISGFDLDLAWEAVWKDATVPPVKDWEVEYFDREENVDYEVRAGLSSVYNVPGKGWIADDVHSESASRTLDYAYDDYAAYVLARTLKKPENVTSFLLERSMRAPFTIFNNETGFMEARNANGSWAGENNGWTEGDKWAYSFDVVHDIPSLIEHRGGNISFVESLETHFNGGHNDHTNEPSHHIPYLYSLAGAAWKTQERVRNIAQVNYNNTPVGLSGNEDCGQMSAWYLFSAMGFYPVNPVSGEYVVGSPFFEEITINLPIPPSSVSQAKRLLTIKAPGAQTKPYIKSLKIDGQDINTPVIRHEQIANGAMVVFEMSDTIESWGNNEDVLQAILVGDKTPTKRSKKRTAMRPGHEEL